MAPTPAPAHAHARILNARIWAVSFGIDNAGLDSQRSMRDLFCDMDLHVVGPLETDLHVSRGSLGSFETSGLFQRAPYIKRPVFGTRDLWVKTALQ
jgi:hypothetical protein